MKRIAYLVLLSVFFMLPPLASATPHCEKCPFSCGQLGLGKKDCSVISTNGGICCLDFTKYGLEVAEARNQVAGNQAPQANHRPSQDRCPEGFQPSENRCRPEERARGCKDIRLPSGLGCVRR